MRNPIARLGAVALIAGLAVSAVPAQARQQGPTCRSMIDDARQVLASGTAVRDGGKGPSSQTAEEPEPVTADQRRDVQELIAEAEGHAGRGEEGLCASAMQRAQSVLFVMEQPGGTAGGDAARR